jgi:ABC-type sugar transport system ATPase subunit
VRLRGEVEIAGRPLAAPSPTGALAAGLVLESEDRKRYGLVLDRDFGFNLSLSSNTKLRRGALVDQGRKRTRTSGSSRRSA